MHYIPCGAVHLLYAHAAMFTNLALLALIFLVTPTSWSFFLEACAFVSSYNVAYHCPCAHICGTIVVLSAYVWYEGLLSISRLLLFSCLLKKSGMYQQTAQKSRYT